MRIVITGASGLIGTNLALRLLDEGHEVFGVDKDPNPWTARVPVRVEDLRTLEGAPGAAWGAADVVVHLAARAKVHESVEHPANALANYTITHRVLEYCRTRRTPIVFGSSREAYGEQALMPVAEDAVRVEGAASPYAAAKLADEALIRAYARCYGVPFLIFRFSNVYGRYDDLARNGRFIPLLCHRLPRGEPITIYGPQKMFDFTYIDDAIDGVCRGLERLAGSQADPGKRAGPGGVEPPKGVGLGALVRAPDARPPDGASGVANQAINLGSGEGTTLLEAAQLVAAAAGVEPNLSFAPMRTGEISRYVADLTRARALLGYEPRYPARVGIPKAYEWWRSWYGPSKSASPKPEV